MSGHASVRVVVVHHGSAELTARAVAALSATDWPGDRLELVVVDNGGDPSLGDRLRDVAPRARVLGDGTNRGFAGGCNVGLRDLDGIDLVALVNPDAVVEPSWLEGLAAGLSSDDIGAACPKILLSGRHQEIELHVEARRRRPLDPRLLGVRFLGVEDLDGRPLGHHLVDGFLGVERTAGRLPYQWTGPRAVLRVRAPEGGRLDAVRLRLGADVRTAVRVVSGGAETELVVDARDGAFPVSVDASPIDVVNNVGNVVLADGSGADRGYLEPDDGRYGRVEDVEAWCGAAVLLRAAYLGDVGLFDERYFLYYEDLDLAVRGARRGWRSVLVPSVVVRHDHSAVAIEGSALADHYKERNRLLFAVRHLAPLTAVRTVVRFLLSTVSYARRDLAAPLLEGRRPDATAVRRRLSSFASFARLAPSMCRSRGAVS